VYDNIVTFRYIYYYIIIIYLRLNAKFCLAELRGLRVFSGHIDRQTQRQVFAYYKDILTNSQVTVID